MWLRIHQNEDKTIDLMFRSHEFKIHLGQLKIIGQKNKQSESFLQKSNER